MKGNFTIDSTFSLSFFYIQLRRDHFCVGYTELFLLMQVFVFLLNIQVGVMRSTIIYISLKREERDYALSCFFKEINIRSKGLRFVQKSWNYVYYVNLFFSFGASPSFRACPIFTQFK